jgi:flavin-dependent dehydrogenase
VGGGEDIFAAKKAFLRRLGIKTAPTNCFGAFIPAAIRPKTSLSHNGYNVLLAGDAAGQVKASTGGGVFFSAKCGSLAGENFSNPKKYEREWRSKYLFDLKLHYALRGGFDIFSPDGMDLWMGAVKLMRINSLLEEIGEMDQYSKMLSPSAISAYAKVIFSKKN